MNARRAARYYHPAVLFAYCVAMLLPAMLFWHPAFIAAGSLAAAALLVLYGGAAGLRGPLVFGLPLFVFVALFNPIVSTRGATLLFYFLGRPFTFEALVYGLCAGGMLLEIFLWFAVYNFWVTPDKFLYLFSRAAPAVSMLLVLTQRMIPLFTRRLAAIRDAQKTLLCDADRGSPQKRLRASLRMTSVLLSWSMEEGLVTADSMRARGYEGRVRRTFAADYRLRRADIFALTLISGLEVCTLAGYFPAVRAQFYPFLRFSFSGAEAVPAAAAFGLLCLLPLAAELYEVIAWR
jgi:energy-coupling factor transport system permease protein